MVVGRCGMSDVGETGLDFACVFDALDWVGEERHGLGYRSCILVI
jgi:hypothetical protein